MSDKIIRELGLNFIERMKQADLHFKYKRGPLYKSEINTRMIEFFTGAYVGLRIAGRDDDAKQVGFFTASLLAPLGYAALCRVVDGKNPMPDDQVVLIEQPSLTKN